MPVSSFEYTILDQAGAPAPVSRSFDKGPGGEWQIIEAKYAREDLPFVLEAAHRAYDQALNDTQPKEVQALDTLYPDQPDEHNLAARETLRQLVLNDPTRARKTAALVVSSQLITKLTPSTHQLKTPGKH